MSPKDEYRYGYRLWIDDSTAMPLKTQLCDARGHVIEQIVFAELKLSSRIADAAFKPDVSTAGFQWLRNDAPPQPPPTAAALAWSAMRLPPGFRMTMRSAQTLPGSPALVDHMVFTDGFASVSVFVETQQAARRAEHRAGVRRRRLLVGVLDHGRRPQGDRGRRGAAGDRQVHRLAGARAGACAGRRPGPLSACRLPASRSCTGTTVSSATRCSPSCTALGRTLALPPIDVVDVDADPVLKRRHGLDVPVLLLEGTVVCRHRLDRGELLRLLQPGPHAATRA